MGWLGGGGGWGGGWGGGGGAWKNMCIANLLRKYERKKTHLIKPMQEMQPYTQEYAYTHLPVGCAQLVNFNCSEVNSVDFEAL